MRLELPTCTYTMSGGGADALFGTVSGGGGVTTLGGSLTTLDVPVDCTTTG